MFPTLETEDLASTVAFYRDVLGFEARGYYPDEENACWASLVNGTVEIAFGGKMLHKDTPGTVMTGALYLNVDDVDGLWESIKDRVTVEFPPQDMAYRMREFGIRDPNGYVLILGEDISNR